MQQKDEMLESYVKEIKKVFDDHLCDCLHDDEDRLWARSPNILLVNFRLRSEIKIAIFECGNNDLINTYVQCVEVLNALLLESIMCGFTNAEGGKLAIGMGDKAMEIAIGCRNKINSKIKNN